MKRALVYHCAVWRKVGDRPGVISWSLQAKATRWIHRGNSAPVHQQSEDVAKRLAEEEVEFREAGELQQEEDKKRFLKKKASSSDHQAAEENRSGEKAPAADLRRFGEGNKVGPRQGFDETPLHYPLEQERLEGGSSSD